MGLFKKKQSFSNAPHEPSTSTLNPAPENETTARHTTQNTTQPPNIEEPPSYSQTNGPPTYTPPVDTTNTLPPPYNPRRGSSVPPPTIGRSPPSDVQFRQRPGSHHGPPTSSSASGGVKEGEVRYKDAKAAELARKASEAGRDDLKAMLDYFLEQRELDQQRNTGPWLLSQLGSFPDPENDKFGPGACA